jgi:pyridoxal phosphate enzyme (YggS family)
VELVAVSKYASAERVAELARAGQRVFGENRLQDALPKIEALAGGTAPAGPLRWHMVGHLQGNKVARAVEAFDMIQSVDSAGLAAAISERALKLGRTVPLLLEVNVAGDPAKFGFTPEGVRAEHAGLRDLPAVDVVGLMTIGPLGLSPEEMRPTFAALRALRDGLDRAGAGEPLHHLSMGMSADYQVAIEEGATIVRVGTALFGSHHEQA